MILVASSVWIDRLRGTRSLAYTRVGEVVAQRPSDVATTEPIQMELLCGSVAELMNVQRLLSMLTVLSIDPPRDYFDAAAIYRSARAIGRPIRKMNDCLIAAVALRTGAELWHKDADFEAIAAVSALKSVDLR